MFLSYQIVWIKNIYDVILSESLNLNINNDIHCSFIPANVYCYTIKVGNKAYYLFLLILKSLKKFFVMNWNANKTIKTILNNSDKMCRSRLFYFTNTLKTKIDIPIYTSSYHQLVMVLSLMSKSIYRDMLLIRCEIFLLSMRHMSEFEVHNIYDLTSLIPR